MRYDIQGGNLPVVICYLENGESVITESGGMSWMSPNMQMQTSSNGGLGKLIGRKLAGDKAFQNIYTCQGGSGMIAFASSFPGSLKAFDITPGNDIILQKRSFLASEAGVEMSIAFNGPKGGFFGGEGFIMQRFSGQGVAFAEFDGSVIEYELQAGQSIVMDTGHLAAMTASCKMDVQTVKGVKNVLLGGEGLFNTVVTGPGHVWIQSMPIINLAALLQPYISSGN
ncbi:MAG: TIGR00266 family protein [Lachnospiraceae bacterium]|nr:TIGR00266 family protein [Lachnospiraceae bacterium]